MNPFQPNPNATATITVTGTSAATAIPRPDCETAELQNNGSVPVFIEFGGSGTPAAVVATSYPILAGQAKVVRVPRGSTHINCISGTTGQTLYVTSGNGN